MNKLQALGQEALSKVGKDTFTLENVETKTTKDGSRVGYRATLDSGKVVTFWDSTMDEVIEAVDEEAGIYAVTAGTTIAPDGGLIPKSKQSKGMWS